MAWRFGNYSFVKDGYLDNTTPGRTTGEIEFADIGMVTFDLHGDMQCGFRHKRMLFYNPKYDPKFVFEHGPDKISNARQYMEYFAKVQRGTVGNILDIPYPYIEWDSDHNGRCVIELPRDCCTIESID